jgi:hypothetical protein
MGHKLNVPGSLERHEGREYRAGMTDEKAFTEAAFYMSYGVANWLH